MSSVEQLTTAIERHYDEDRKCSLHKTELALYRALVTYMKDYDGDETGFIDYAVSQLHIHLLPHGGNQAVVDWYLARADARAKSFDVNALVLAELVKVLEKESITTVADLEMRLENVKLKARAKEIEGAADQEYQEVKGDLEAEGGVWQAAYEKLLAAVEGEP